MVLRDEIGNRGWHLNRSAATGVFMISPAQPTARGDRQTPRCAPAAALAAIPELPEGSGLAASRTTPGRFWAHNDSGDAVLFALDTNGRVAGRLQLAGAAVDDWEAVAMARGL